MRYVLAVGVLFAWSAVARADGNGSAAASMFERGRQLAEEGNFLEACTLFERSYELEPALGTLLNFAHCREQLGDLADAWRLFSQALRQASREQDDTRVAFTNERIEKLESRLVTVSLTVPDAAVARLRIAINGRPVATAPEVSERVNPGEVTLELVALGGKSHVQRARARAGETVTFTVPADLVVPPARPAQPAPAAVTDDPRPRRLWLGLFIGGIGIGAAGMGLLYVGNARMDEVRREVCRGGGYDTSDTPDTVDGIDCKSPPGPMLTDVQLDEANARGDRAERMANIGLGVAVAGVALAATSAYVYFIRKPAASARTTATVIPSVSPLYAGAALHVDW